MLTAQQALKAGLPATYDRITLDRFSQEWLANIKPSVRQKTFISYEGMIRLHIVPTLGRKQLTAITVQDVEKLLRAKTDSGLKPHTVRRIRDVLRCCLEHAVLSELVGRNVAKLAAVPKVEQKEHTLIGLDQEDQFLAAIRGNKHEALFTLLFYTGMRRGEALALRWKDYDAETGTLSITATLARVEGELRRVPTKTRASGRTLILDEQTRAALKAHKVRQTEQRLAATEWQDTGYMFTNPNGGPLDARNVLKTFQKTLEAAELPVMTIHELRHSAAMNLDELGLANIEIQHQLGHSRESTTTDIYKHYRAKRQAAAAAALNARRKNSA